MFVIVAGVVFLVVTLPIVFVMMPIFNSAFEQIWSDPRDEQARAAVKRLKELAVDGHVPAETATMMAASEMRATEKEFFDAISAVNPQDAVGMIAGRRSFLGRLFGGLDRTIRRR